MSVEEHVGDLLSDLKFELLPNEFWLDVFEYFTTADLFNSFYGLNDRFDTLLLIYIQLSCRLDLRSISKNHLNIIYRHYLPSVANRLIYLCLSDDDETIGQREQLEFDRLLLRQFNRVQYLSLNRFGLGQTIDFLTNLSDHLIHLTLMNIDQTNNPSNLLGLLNKVWSLPQLTYCQLIINSKQEISLLVPTVVSFSLRYLTIGGVCYQLRELTNLLELTPALQHLAVNFQATSNSANLTTFSSSSLTALKVTYRGSPNDLIIFLRRLPHLSHLTIEAENSILNGGQFARTIRTYLPELTVLQLLFRFSLSTYGITRDHVYDLRQTYQSDFWTRERQCTVRHQEYRWGQTHMGLLYVNTVSSRMRRVRHSSFD